MSEKVEVAVCVDQSGKTASAARVRDHHLIMDRPEAKGGENQGPMGGEVLLMGLGGCFMSNLLAAADARDTELAGVTLDIRGTLEGPPTRFSAIAMTVSIPRVAPDKAEKIVTIAERGCIVANTLRKAVDLTIRTKTIP